MKTPRLAVAILAAGLLGAVGCPLNPPDFEGSDAGSIGSSCSGPNPAGCTTDEDCDSGEVCRTSPDRCAPSSCSCSDGTWTCTDDCSGTVCTEPMDAGEEPRDTGRDASFGMCSERSPPLCESDEDCSGDRVCRTDAEICIPSQCECRGSGTWSCTSDCSGKGCLPPRPETPDAGDTGDDGGDTDAKTDDTDVEMSDTDVEMSDTDVEMSDTDAADADGSGTEMTN